MTGAPYQDILSEQVLLRHLPEGIFPRVFDEIGSTNTLGKQLAAQGAPEGTLLVAKRQTAGHGRRGRDFFSAAETGLYMSLVLRPTIPARDAILLTAAAGVAVTDALQALLGLQAGIKWVNDVFADGKKLCGILCESALDASNERLAYAVLGIGVNVYPPPDGFPQTLSSIAGAALPTQIAPMPDLRATLAGEIVRRFLPYYHALLSRAYLPAYRQRSILLGKDVTVLSPQGEYTATAVSIDDDCHLVIRRPDGTLEPLSSGEVSIRPQI